MSTKENESIVSGTVHKVGETQKVTDTFSKRTLVVDTGEKYGNLIPVEFVQDKADHLDGLREGMEVKVHADLDGRYSEKHDRYFLSLKGWKVEQIVEKGVAVPTDGAVEASAQPDSEYNDDLPF